MELTYVIHYDLAVVKEDIPRLTKTDKERIKSAIETKLTTAPALFGKPLRTSLKGLRTLRVGDYRVIFQITGQDITIYAIQHRSVIYDAITKRM